MTGNTKTNKDPMTRSSRWGKTATRLHISSPSHDDESSTSHSYSVPLSPTTTPTTPRPPRRRLVLFAGPHKSASTSIQKFFTKHMANTHQHDIHNSLNEWIWPYEPFGQHPGSYNDLVVNYGPSRDQSWHDLRRAELYFTISFVWEHHNRYPLSTSSSSSSHKNVILGSEEFDRIPNETPWSKRDGIHSMENIIHLLDVSGSYPPTQIDIVINYRTPRVSHWISIWKQLTRQSGMKSYRGLVQNNDKTYEHLNAVGNPLGLAYMIRQRHSKSTSSTTTMVPSWNVTIIDMGGVDHDGLDISHVIACEVMNVPCNGGNGGDTIPDSGDEQDENTTTAQTNGNGHDGDINKKKNGNNGSGGLVQGLEDKQLHSNRRMGDPGLTLHQLNELEWLFRQRDCAYMEDLLPDPGVTLLHRDTLFQTTMSSSSSSNHSNNNSSLSYHYECDRYDPDLQQTLRYNGTFFLYLVQAQVDLGPGVGLPGYNISELRQESLLVGQGEQQFTTTISQKSWWKSSGSGGRPHGVSTTTKASRRPRSSQKSSFSTFSSVSSLSLSASTGSSSDTLNHLTSIAIFQMVALLITLGVTLHKIGMHLRRRRQHR